MMMQNEQEDDEGFDSKWSKCVKNYCINRTEPLNFCWCREICCPVPFHCRQFCNDGLLFLQVLHLLLPLAEVMLLDPASDNVELSLAWWSMAIQVSLLQLSIRCKRPPPLHRSLSQIATYIATFSYSSCILCSSSFLTRYLRVCLVRVSNKRQAQIASS